MMKTNTVQRRPLERLFGRTEAGPAEDVLDLTTPIDRTRHFVCPSLTPLYYAPSYQSLSAEQRLRYNQLTALSFNELISFFETSFAASVLAALNNSRHKPEDEALHHCLKDFLAEEKAHTEWWDALSRLSDPELYQNTDRAITQIPATLQTVLSWVTRTPEIFPVVFWIMLSLEERSLEISKRCIEMPRERIEPRYLAVYKTHLADEARHVQIDWHLIERYYSSKPRLLRLFNGKLFSLAFERYLLPPTRTAVRVINLLMKDFPELHSIQSQLISELRKVGEHPEFKRMMCSAESTPITFFLFEQFAEFHPLRDRLTGTSSQRGVCT